MHPGHRTILTPVQVCDAMPPAIVVAAGHFPAKYWLNGYFHNLLLIKDGSGRARIAWVAGTRSQKQSLGATMLRRMLTSKIHRATVTRIDVDYEGSITVDAALM